ncbi:MAG: aminotransferase class V-fold PLP-dependent enzyme [Myxococcota bacterium]|nr:aminotransferase class V-fold PLP-dependent enzyme [Myxococcota bacterium]
MKIPNTPMDAEAILDTLRHRRGGDVRWREGRAWGFVYDAGHAVEEIARKAHAMFMSDNGLDPTAFPSLLSLENDLVAMAAAHLDSPPGVVGSFTSGGTESIILAVKAARDWARTHRPDIQRPAMVLPVTAHAAFHKAAHYLGVEVVVVPVDTDTFAADVDAMAEAITDETVLLVGSAPSYAHGCIDPIAALGQLAHTRGLLFHVDACIGGFLLPYFRRLGEPVPDFGFNVEGVTSLSMDLHKYAYVPKGASVVLYRDAALRSHQMYACSTWTGYSVVNPTVQSTKSGGPLAAAWAVMNYLGEGGFERLASEVLGATKAIIAGVESIDGLRILGRPDMSLLAIASDEVGIYHVVDEMGARGWYVQAQLARGGSPPNLHLTVAPNNVPLVEQLIADLRASVEAARAFGPSEMAQRVGQVAASLDPSTMSPEVFQRLLAMAGLEGTELPSRMAEINEVLDVLPEPVCERVLVEFLGALFVPTDSDR